MKVKNNIIIKDNFFNENVLKKIKQDILKLKFVIRYYQNDSKDKKNNRIYFNVDLNMEHFAVKEVYKNLKKYFKNIKNLKKSEHHYFLSTKHIKATPHMDSCHINCLVYLKGNYLINSGTGFYDKNEDTGEYILNTHVGFKENRAIIFDSSIYHASLQFNENCGTRYAMANFFYN